MFTGEMLRAADCRRAVWLMSSLENVREQTQLGLFEESLLPRVRLIVFLGQDPFTVCITIASSSFLF